ncbi:hypothetical protein SAMN04489712_13158 [Thermomonospora echinospora]|uniref:DDE superfamily endonuclease n=1 Tax=Thermomonospora echinospora TaxID=1992 RepID=A0A1H6E4R6_9ACTN|nr:hypothetical protein SAMN04489712_13158 [Thermomonospora echinospora]
MSDEVIEAVLQSWVAELERCMRGSRAELCGPSRRSGRWAYVSGPVAGLERKNGWMQAEHAGVASPDGMQRLLRRADWDIDGARDDLRDYAI